MYFITHLCIDFQCEQATVQTFPIHVGEYSARNITSEVIVYVSVHYSNVKKELLVPYYF